MLGQPGLLGTFLGFSAAHPKEGSGKKETVKMTNKILVAFVVADVLFLLSGAVELGFSIVVGNIMTETAVDGQTAARNLLYQRFPLQGALDRDAVRKHPSLGRRWTFITRPTSRPAETRDMRDGRNRC